MTKRRNPSPKVKPLMLWHATDKAFERFDPDRSGLGTHFGTYRAAKGRATAISRIRREYKRPTGEWRVTKYKVFVTNPLRTHDFGTWDTEPDVEHHLMRLGLMTPQELPITRRLPDMAAFWRWVRNRIEAAGYDSIVYNNRVEDQGKDSYVIWRDDQIEYAPQPIANPSRRRVRPTTKRRTRR